MIDQELAFDFLKRAYFGSIRDGIDVYSLASNRAYRDLCRTIQFTDKPKRSAQKSVIESFTQKKQNLRASVTSVLRDGISSGLNEKNYDKWHEDTCDKIVSTYKEKSVDLTYGQAQKWVNMFMKYLCVISPKSVSPFFNKLHVPFDNIVIEMAVEMAAFERPLKRWSNWTKKEYLDYRTKLNNKIKEKYPDTSPIVWEFKYWKGDIED